MKAVELINGVTPPSPLIHGPGKGRIVTGPAGARLRHVASGRERPERRARSIPRDTGDLPAADDRAQDVVVGVELGPFPNGRSYE